MRLAAAPVNMLSERATIERLCNQMARASTDLTEGIASASPLDEFICRQALFLLAHLGYKVVR